MSACENEYKTRAWVVFSGQTDLRWLGVLKAGYRHCYVLLHDGRHWVSVDPLSNYMEVRVHHVPPDFDLPLWLADRGHRVMAAPMDHSSRRAAPFMLFSCVEAVKRVLGIRSRWIVTPWQLCRYLERFGKEASPDGVFCFNPLNQGDLSWEV